MSKLSSFKENLVRSEPIQSLPRPLKLQLTSHPSQIGVARRAVEAYCLECGFSAAAAGEVGLCLNEALANVIRHAYRGSDDQPIVVEAEIVRRGNDSAESSIADVASIRVTVRDWGTGVNPGSLPPKPHDPLQPGGVGLICLQSLMDEIVFEPQSDGMLLTLTKHRPR